MAKTTSLGVFIVVVSTVWMPAAHAILPASPQQMTCPLTGEVFQFTASYGSFTAFGSSLDFEPLVMGRLRSSPRLVPQCPDSGLPIYRTFSNAEIEKLRSMVDSPAWKERLALNNPIYLVAYTKFILGEDEVSIAGSLLNAVWIATPENTNFMLGRAIDFWSHIANTRQQRDNNWVVANWLRIELNRQLSEFERADYWLRDFEQRIGTNHAPITDEMIVLERQLITNKNATPAAVRKSYSP